MSREVGIECASLDCGLAGRSFPRFAGQHVLVDFERSVLTESELRAREGASAIKRRGDGGAVGVLRRLSSPGTSAAGAHARDLVARLLRSGDVSQVLVVGGGTRGGGTRPLYETPGIEVIAFDIYASSETQFVADAHQIPLADESVQAVWVQAVLEHVLDPAQVVSEIRRVLPSGGLVYAETPFLQHVHEGPWDFTRFTESGHRWLFRSFERLDSGVVAGPATVWVWATEQLTRGLTRSFAAGKLARLAFSWVHLLDRAIPRGHAVDGASCVFFYGTRAAATLAPFDAVRHYIGAQRPDSLLPPSSA